MCLFGLYLDNNMSGLDGLRLMFWNLKVQRTATSAMSWLRKRGGHSQPKDIVCRLSKLATGGKHLQNAERDMHRLLRKVSLSLAAAPETVMVRMVNPSSLEIAWEPLPVMFPDTVLKALWDLGEDVFRHALFGTMTERETFEFWNHVRKECAWFKDLPARDHHCLGRLASVGMYGDEIQCYKNSECGVVSVNAWTSEFSVTSEPLLRYWPLAVWSEHCECIHTYSDFEQLLLPRWEALTDPTASWPWTSRGYLLSFTFTQGDLKWINGRMGGLHNFRANEMCSRCKCQKTCGDLTQTLPNMAEDPDAFEHRVFSRQELQQFSPLFSLPGMSLERVQHDVAHSQFLGTGKATNGNLAIL